MKSKTKRAKVSTKQNDIDNLVNTIDEAVIDIDTLNDDEIVEFVESMSPKDKIAYFKALKVDKANNLKITAKTVGLGVLAQSFKYTTLGEIYKASLIGKFITFLQLHTLLPLYDIKGLSRDVNTKETKVLRNVKANESNDDTKAIGDVSNIWYMNIDIKNILAQSDDIAKCKNDNSSYNVDLMKSLKITPRDIYRNDKIVEVVTEFEFDEVICEFETIELNEVKQIRSLGKNNEVISYKHNNSIRVIYGFELMKVYLTTYGETFETE